MGSTQNRACWHRNRHIIIPIILVLVSSFSTHFTFMAEATRPIPTELPEAATTQGGHVLKEENVGAGEAVNARQIGSRPPRCQMRCIACGHCVAVQVPVAPLVQQSHNNGRQRSSSSASSTRKTSPKSIAYSRGGDDLSNYKPISWKCKNVSVDGKVTTWSQIINELKRLSCPKCMSDGPFCCVSPKKFLQYRKLRASAKPTSNRYTFKHI